MKALLLILLVAYAGYAALMVWLHPRFIYPFQPDDRVLPGFERVELTAGDGTSVFVQEHPGDGPALVYFMGNAGSLSLFETAFTRHLEAGRHVIALEYRGGAGRPGSPNEAQLKSDALLAADHAARLGKPIIVQGFSLGTGLATHVAARRDVAAVILTAPYDRLCTLMAKAAYLPACLLPVQKWQSLKDARGITAPILVLHGDKDTLIPPSASRSFEDLPTVRREVIPGAAHNDIGGFPAFDDAVESFLQAL